MIVKHTPDGRLYEVHHVYHSNRQDLADDVYACHLLCAYDGMPIGPLTYVRVVDCCTWQNGILR